MPKANTDGKIDDWLKEAYQTVKGTWNKAKSAKKIIPRATKTSNPNVNAMQQGLLNLTKNPVKTTIQNIKTLTKRKK